MPIYNAPLADMKFILNDVFKAEQFGSLMRILLM